MIETLLKKIEKKDYLRLYNGEPPTYVQLRDALTEIDPRIAEQLRDDLWKHRDMKRFITEYVEPGFISMKPEYEDMTDEYGYFNGKGLSVPAKDIVARVRELLNLYT